MSMPAREFVAAHAHVEAHVAPGHNGGIDAGCDVLGDVGESGCIPEHSGVDPVDPSRADVPLRLNQRLKFFRRLARAVDGDHRNSTTRSELYRPVVSTSMTAMRPSAGSVPQPEAPH
jgi:hypothetical protein